MSLQCKLVNASLFYFNFSRLLSLHRDMVIVRLGETGPISRNVHIEIPAAEISFLKLIAVDHSLSKVSTVFNGLDLEKRKCVTPHRHTLLCV